MSTTPTSPVPHDPAKCETARYGWRCVCPCTACVDGRLREEAER